MGSGGRMRGMGNEVDTTEHGPLSWRDVYKAVGESEERIVAAIGAAVAPITARQIDHEGRLRAIESGDLPWVNRLEIAANATHADQGRRLGIVETAILTLQAQIKGATTTLGVGKQVTLLVFGIVGAISAFYSVYERLAP